MSAGGRDGYSSEDDLSDVKSDLVSSSEIQFSSAPPSPKKSVRRSDTEFTLLSVSERVSSFENLAPVRASQYSTMTWKDELKNHMSSRSGHKGHITRQLKLLEDGETTLNEMMLDRVVKKVSYHLDKIEDLEIKMAELWDAQKVPFEDEFRQTDAVNSDKYQLEITSKLSDLKKSLVDKSDSGDASNQDIVDALSKGQGMPGRNLISCERFDGGEKDAFAFKFWLSQFENMLASGKNMAGRYKLSALRNHITHTGLAFKNISRLDINDGNYMVALDLLKKEFMDSNKITDKLLDTILESEPKYDPDYDNLRLYVAEIRSILNDLNKSYNVDLESEGTGGYKLVSKIIFSKLPQAVQRELIKKVASTYPTLNQIFDNIKDTVLFKMLGASAFYSI